MAEIEAELGEEESRKNALAELEAQLKGLVASRKVQEEALASVKQVRAALEKQRELVNKMDEAVQRSLANLDGLKSRLAGRQAEREPHADLLRRVTEIEAAYTALQKARIDLEKWDQIAERFREYDQLRQPLLREIESEQARLEEEQARSGTGTAGSGKPGGRSTHFANRDRAHTGPAGRSGNKGGPTPQVGDGNASRAGTPG